MKEWKEYKLEDFAEVHNQMRIPLSKMERTKRQGSYPYYGASGIIDYVDDFLFDGEFVLISEDGENLKSRKTPIVFKASGKFWVNNHAHIIRGKKDFHNDLIIYYFKNLNLIPFITGAVQPKLNKANLLSIPIYLPKCEEEQKQIAEVLSSLDDKIDLLHRQNKTLEAMAETLFREWFVPADRSSGEGRERAEEDWEVGKLEDLLDIKYGKDHKHLEVGEIPVYGSGGIMRYVNQSLYTKESILIPRKGTLSNLFYLNEPFWSVDTMFYSIIKKKEYGKYCFLLLKTKNLASMNVGSAVPSLTTKLLNSIPVLIPPIDIMRKFDAIISDKFIKIKFNQTQIQTLENLRDTLLPKLMSGAIKVAENE